jgi:citrate lyase subunit beta/citryl-CoA lyase
MLFVPGNSEKMIAKIPTFAPGSFILDLEDSVPPSEKERARNLTRDAIQRYGGDHDLHVRINTAGSPHMTADLRQVIDENLSGIVVPKVESRDDIRTVNSLIVDLADERELSASHISIMATIETAIGLHRIYDISSAGGLLRRLSFGSGDFALDLSLDWPDQQGIPDIMLWAKIQLVMASRIAGLELPHDGSYTNYRDLEGLTRESRQSRRQGYGGKHAIHPSQVPIIDAIFRPSEEQVERARRLVEAFELAEASGSGAVGVDGELVDYAIIQRARNLLNQLEA